MAAQPNQQNNSKSDQKDNEVIAAVFADVKPLSDEHIDVLSSITLIDEEVILAVLLKRNPQLHALLTAEEE